MLDFELTEEQVAIQEMARQFAEKEIRPIAEKLDRSENLLADFPWDLVKKADAAGLRTIGLPEEYGGLGYDYRTQLVIIDELSYACMACGKIISQSWKTAAAIARKGTKDQKERFLTAFRDDPTFLMGGAGTEPGAGSDNFLPYEGAEGGMRVTAVRRGDHYVLNGIKHFISHGPVAKLLIVEARTDKTVGGPAGNSMFLVPTDTPGFKVARVFDKVGFRMYLQGELHFDEVKVPVANLFGGGEGQARREGPGAAIELSAHAMALARAALDEAIKHASMRVQGGKLIIQHQAVAMDLAEMYQELQAGRTLLWRLAWAADTGRSDPALAHTTKVFCTEGALKIALIAMEMFGGSGVMRDMPMQKYVRDAMTIRHLEGTQNINRIKVGRVLETRFREEGRLSV